MKAKAMKKTLSCILALTLTASMMAESLTAFAAGTKTENTSISGTDAPEVEDDAVPEGGEIVTADDFDDFKTVLTTGQSEFLDEKTEFEAGSYYQISAATLTDNNGVAIAANTDIFVDGLLTNANVGNALKNYYVKFVFNKMTPVETVVDELITHVDVVASNTQTATVYVPLNLFTYSNTMTGAPATVATANVLQYGLFTGGAATAWTGTQQADIIDGKEDQTLGIYFKKLGYEANYTPNAETGYTKNGNGVKTKSADDALVETATAIVDVFKVGVKALTINYNPDETYYSGSTAAYAFRNATYQFQYNNKETKEAAVALVTNGVMATGFTCDLDNDGEFDDAALGAAGAGTVQFKFTAPAATAGFVAGGSVTEAEATAITITADRLADELALVTAEKTNNVVSVVETTQSALPTFDQSFTAAKFYTGSVAIMAEHENGKVHYLLAVPTGDGDGGAITGGAITGAKWYYTASEDNLFSYVSAYKAWEEKAFAGDAATEAAAFVAAKGNLTEVDATLNGDSDDVTDPTKADYALNAKGTKITINYEGGETTLDVNKARLFDWDAATSSNVGTTAVYTGESIWDVVTKANKVISKINIKDTTTLANEFITGEGTTANPYAVADGYSIIVSEFKTAKNVADAEPTITVKDVYNDTSTAAELVLPDEISADDNYTYEYKITVAKVEYAKDLSDSAAILAALGGGADSEKLTNSKTINLNADELRTFVPATKADDKIENASTTLPTFTAAELASVTDTNAGKFYTGQVVIKVPHANKTNEFLVAVPEFQAGGTVKQVKWFASTDAAAVDALITAYKTLSDAKFSDDAIIAFGKFAVVEPEAAAATGAILAFTSDDHTVPLTNEAAAECTFKDGAGKVNVVYNKTAGTMTVKYKGGTYAFNVAASADFDLTAASKTAIAAKTVYPGGSIFDVIDKDVQVSTTKKSGGVKTVGIINASDPEDLKIEVGYVIVITETATTKAGVKTVSIVATYDSTSDTEEEQLLPAIPGVDGTTYTYQISIIKGSDKATVDGDGVYATIIDDRETKAENPAYDSEFTESALVDLKLTEDSISTIALATTADLTGVASTFPSFKYGDEFYTGSAVLKVTHANGSVDFILGVPVFRQFDVDQEETTSAIVVAVDWCGIPISKENESDRKITINSYLTALATYNEAYTEALAKETYAEKKAAVTAAINAFNTSVAELQTIINFVGEFNSANPYKTGDIVLKNKVYYEFIDDQEADTAWTPAKVVLVEFDLSNYQGVFAAANAYAVGDIVKYTDDKYYKFKAAHVATAEWDAANVDEVVFDNISGAVLELTEEAAKAKWPAYYKLFYDFKAQSNPGSIAFTYRGKTSEAIPVTITGATVDSVQGAIAAKVTNTNLDTYNADRIIKAQTAATADQNATAAGDRWLMNIPNDADPRVYTVPEDGDSVFFFNLDTKFTDEQLKAAIKEGDAVITYVLNGDAANPVTKDLAKGLADGTFGVLKAYPLEKAGAQWLGFYYVDNTNIDPVTKEAKRVSFYLPVFVGMGKKIPVIKTATAAQKYYYIGEALNKNGIKVDLKDFYSYQIAKSDADQELKEVVTESTTGYWSVWFDNGEAKAPNITAGTVLTAINTALTNGRKGEIIVYNVKDDIYGEANNALDILKFKTNYAKSISIDVENIKKTYQVGYYPDGGIINQATLPVVEKIVKGATLTVSFANMKDQADVTIPFDKFINTDASPLTEMSGRMAVKKSVTGGRELDGIITVEAVSGVTNGGKATPGKVARYKISFIPAGVFATDDEIAPVYVDINTEQVEIKKVELYDGKTISADDYYIADNPAATQEDAEDCMPTTQFYVGEVVDDDAVTLGYNASRDGFGTKNGSFLVTFTDGKKQLVPYNGTAGHVTIDFPVIDTTTEQVSRKVSFTYEVDERKGYYKKYKTPEPLELTVSVTQDEILSFDVDTAHQGTIVFYQGDTTYNFDTRTNPDNENNDVAFEEKDHYYVTAVYKNRGIVENAFDLLKSSDLIKFTYADSEFSTITAETGDKTLTFKYVTDKKTTELKLPIKVKEIPVTLTVNKNGMQTVFEKGTFTGLDDKGTITLDIGGEKPVTKVFKINDILSNSDELGEYKGRFKVVDQKQKVITDKTIKDLAEGYNTLSFIFFRTIPNDPDKVATVDLDVSILNNYVAKLVFDPEEVPETAQKGYVNGVINFDKAKGGVGVKYFMSDAASTEQTLDISTLPIYKTDEDGNPTKTIINGVTASSLTGILKHAYMTVTTEVAQNDGTTKIVTDYEKSGTKNVFKIAGPHLVHIQVDDQYLEFTVNVEAVKPASITLGTGADAPKYGKDGTNKQYEGQELVFTAGKATVTYNDGTSKTINLATEKNLSIKPGTFDKDTASAAAQHVILQYTEPGCDPVETASGALDVVVLEDAVDSFKLFDADGELTAATTEADPVIFYVGDSNTEFNEYQNISAEFTMTSGTKITVDNIAKSTFNKNFKFEHLTTSSATDDKIGKDWMNVTYGTKTIKLYYTCKVDKIVDAVPTPAAYFDNPGDNALKTAEYLVGDTDLDLSGYYFNVTFESGKTAKKVALSNLPTGYYVAILSEDGTTQIVADITKATATEKANLTAGTTYTLGINYSEMNGTAVKAKALDVAEMLEQAQINYYATTAWADSIVVSTAPTGFGGKKEKLVIKQYEYANADEFLAALYLDATFALTAKAGTTEIVTGSVAAGFDFDASGIDFTTATDGSDYKLKVTYQRKTIEIPVTVEARTVRELSPNVHGDTITLGVGEVWDGKHDHEVNVGTLLNPVLKQDVEVQVIDSNGQDLALINLADEIEAEIKKPGSSKVTVTYDTSTAGSIKITVGYAGKTCTLDATVVEPVGVEALEFITMPTQLKYNSNETPNLEGATVIARYATNSAVLPAYWAEVKDLSILQKLDFAYDNVAKEWEVTVGKFDYSSFDDLAKALSNVVGGILHIEKSNDAKQVEKDKKFELVDSTPKSIAVFGAETDYYLAYTGKYAENTSDDKLIAHFTQRTIPAEDKLPVEGSDIGTPMSLSAIESQQFDATKGIVTVTYLDREATDKQIIEFNGNVSGSTGEAPIRIKINGAPELTPTLPTAKGTYTANVAYYESADITADKVKTDSYSINVLQDEITGFELKAPDDTEVIQGSAINLTGAKATMIFKSGRQVDPIQLTSDAGRRMFKVSAVDNSDELVDKTQTIYVQYYEYDENGNEIAVGDPSTFEITLKKNIARKIEVTRRPKNKYSYNTSDDDFDFTGGELTVTWEKAIDENGTKTSVVDMQEAYESGALIVEKVDFRTAVASKTITIEYLGQKTTIEISIDADPITGIVESTEDPITKKVALEATLEDFIKKGSVVISYELGEDKVVKLSDEHITIEGWDTTKATAIDLFITYTEGKYKSEKLKVTVNVGTNAVESITCDTTEIKLMKGDTLTLADYPVTITYSDEGVEATKTTLANPDDKLIVKFYKVEGETETEIDAIDTSVVGAYRIKATSNEDKTSKASAIINVTVEDIKVLTIKHAVGAIRVPVNGTLELDSEKVTITYDNAKQTTDTVSLATVAKIKYTIKDDKGETIEKIDTTKAGSYTVYVTSVEDPTFKDMDILTVTVSDLEVESFTLSTTELRIQRGDKVIDMTDIKATVTYTDPTVDPKKYDLMTDLSKFIINADAVKLDTVGVYDLIVILKEDPSKTATIKVTVYDETIKELKVLPEAITIKKGTDLTDPTALAALLAPLNPTATITYTDGTTERTEELAIITNIDKFIIDASKVDTATVGTYDLTVALKEDITKTATIKVTVSDVTVKSFTVTPTTVKIKKGTDISDAAKLVAILTPLNPTATVVTVEDETEKTEEIAIITNVDKFVIDASKIDTTKTGDYDLTIALKADPTKTATIKVTVYDKVITDFKLSATTIEVKTGDAADYQKKYEAITVDIAYDEDGTASTASIALNADDARIKIEGSADISKAGVYPIIVRSTEDGTKFATLTITVVDGNKISDEDVDDVPEETPTINSRVVVFEKSGDEWKESKGFENLAAALDSKTGYGKGEGDYMFVIAGDISESSALKFPSKAKSITIVGDGKINLGKATTINIKGADISIDAEITGADLNVTLGAGKTLKIGERTKKLGKLTGNKSGSTLDVLGSTTIGNILTFSKVYASDGSIITIPAKGKVQNIGTLKAEIVLDGTATVSGTTVDEGIFHLTKNGAAKQPIAKVTLAGETKTFLDIIIDNEDTAIDGGMKVLYGSGKFNAAKNVNIINKDAQGNDLNAVSYNNNKEVRAENTEAITYQIGEGEELSTSSFEALFDLLKTETGEVTVTVNSDSVISKNNIPKKLKSLTIKGASDDVKVTCNLTSFKVSYDLHFEDIIIDAVNAKGALNAITISSNGSSMSFINTNINSKSISITGNKKNTTLLISGLSLVDKLQNFKEVVVTGSAFINKNFAVETLMLSFDSFISFGNSCVVKITKLSGEGVIGLEKPESPKKSKAITLTSSDITEEGAVQLVEIKRESLNSMFVIAVAQNEGSFSAGTQIFTDKSKGAIAYDKIFDATGLKEDGKLTNTKGKVVLS